MFDFIGDERGAMRAATHRSLAHVLRRHAAFLGVLCSAAACTTVPPTTPCPDLSGTYADLSEPSAVSLATVLFNAPSSVGTLTLSRAANDALVVSTVGERHILRPGADFSCADGQFELGATTQTASAVPPLASTREVTRYIFQRLADGSLVAHRSVTTSAVAYGIPFSGPAHRVPDLVWNIAR
ncbi:hypothetical protein [Pigmentiphaga sp.]|uniref:hypothetical protein n=1 Tax=Pigmentiphaga sp. TaxID=1977564 RepID=UPI0025F8A8D6|nr:hypothetical protein [Pigmentiphaga sp.]